MAEGRRPFGIGDVPEDLHNWFREWVPEILGFLPKKPLDVLLRDFGEIFTMAPQDVVPAFAKPFKVTTVPAGVTLPPVEVVQETFYNIVCFECPPGMAAIVTTIHQELEAVTAYDTVGVRIFYREASDEWWYPHKPEVTPVSIVLFEKETICIQAENNDYIPHTVWGEVLGYVFPINKPSKNQYGLRVDIGSSKQG
jgi:hypothetical protein